MLNLFFTNICLIMMENILREIKNTTKQFPKNFIVNKYCPPFSAVNEWVTYLHYYSIGNKKMVNTH